MTRLALLACVVGLSCKSDKPADKGGAKPATAASPCAKAETKGPIAWIEDDYPTALACAREKKLPLVLDLWAPWCHTCLAMQTTVFMDPSFANAKFVFASLDADREVNAAAIGKFAASAMPTFYVIGNDEAVLARFIGAADTKQFLAFLASGAAAASGGGAVADARLLGGQRALAKRDYTAADEEFTAALAAMPENWARRDELLNAIILVKSKRGDAKGCLDIAEKYMEVAGNNALATNFIGTADGCVEKAKASEPERAAKIRQQGIARWKAILADKTAPLSIDDRAEALGYMRDALDASGKPDEAKQVAEQVRVMLDDAMAKAPTPLEKMTHLWLRCEVYVYLKRPLDLVADIEALAKQLPKEYDPPARLGWLYLKAGKLDEAAKWTEQALGLVYGPRKGRLLAQRAEIAKAAGDKATERRYREDAVKLWESLPPGQQNPDNLEAAKKALAAIDAPPSGSAAPKH